MKTFAVIGGLACAITIGQPVRPPTGIEAQAWSRQGSQAPDRALAQAGPRDRPQQTAPAPPNAGQYQKELEHLQQQMASAGEEERATRHRLADLETEMTPIRERLAIITAHRRSLAVGTAALQRVLAVPPEARGPEGDRIDQLTHWLERLERRLDAMEKRLPAPPAK